MATTTIKHCVCARCNATWDSIGAKSYAETKVWDKHGTFSGSGLGIGTGGIGIFKLVQMSRKEEHLNAEVYPKQLARYHELQYC